MRIGMKPLPEFQGFECNGRAESKNETRQNKGATEKSLGEVTLCHKVLSCYIALVCAK